MMRQREAKTGKEKMTASGWIEGWQTRLGWSRQIEAGHRHCSPQTFVVWTRCWFFLRFVLISVTTLLLLVQLVYTTALTRGSASTSSREHDKRSGVSGNKAFFSDVACHISRKYSPSLSFTRSSLRWKLTAVYRHASSNLPTNQPSEMTHNPPPAQSANPPGICPTDASSIVPIPSTDPADRTKRKIPKQSWEYAVRSGTAGGLAACAAKTVVAPLDRVKILFQASNPQFQKYTGSWSGVFNAISDIYHTDGGKGLFRGHSATLLRIFPYGGIKFLAYEQIRAILITSKEQETPYRRFMAGALSGCTSVFATYPLEVIRVRLAWETKSQSRVNVRTICRTIYHERPPVTRIDQTVLHDMPLPRAAAATLTAGSAAIDAVTPRSGLANFFRGFTPTLWGMIPYAGASFLTHDAAGDFMRQPALASYTVLPLSERSQKQLAPNKPAPLRAWAELTTGALAGFVSQTVSYPLEVIRRRMQVGGVVGDGHRLTMIEVARNIARQKGWKGFFVGLSIGYVKVVPMAATSFFAYERLKVMFGI